MSEMFREVKYRTCPKPIGFGHIEPSGNCPSEAASLALETRRFAQGVIHPSLPTRSALLELRNDILIKAQ